MSQTLENVPKFDFEDDQMLQRFLNVKRSIFVQIGKEKIIEYILQRLDEIPWLNFERASDRRFISRSRPTLQLLISLEMIKDLEGGPFLLADKIDAKEAIRNRSVLVHTHLVEPFNRLLQDIFAGISIVHSDMVDKDKEKRLKGLSTYEYIAANFDLQAINIDTIREFNGEQGGVESSEDFQQMLFLLSTIAGLTFPNPEEADIDTEDTGFTLELMF